MPLKARRFFVYEYDIHFNHIITHKHIELYYAKKSYFCIKIK
jgi:hypothetical protein